ncbi:hypothetical protein BGZ95_008893 [Linnemannia exigua]|uniref:Uncharacterized protein n=1 Tax=Linnemannia exigua TaxID=604196 RepID=A0AAD4DKU5_9FUNG|nr:hypothetical protein BGZ95_008893 [Linnemannia exigua]
MSQHHAVGSIDPFAHTSSDQPGTVGPSRVAAETPRGSFHHAASPSIGGEIYQQSQSLSQNQAPRNLSSSPSTITTTTTTAPSTTPGRKPSLTDTLIAGATTAATTATHAATSAVAAVRRLVGEGGSTEVDLDDEATDTAKVEGTSSSKGLFSFMKPSINNGLEFSRRKLSSNKNKTHSASHPASSAAPAPVPTLASAPTPASIPSSMPSMPSPALSSAPNIMSTAAHTASNATTTDPMHHVSNTMHPTTQNTEHSIMQTSMYPSQNAVHHSMPAPAPTPIPAQPYEPAPTGITFSEKPPLPFATTNNNSNNNNNNKNNTTDTATAASTNPIPRRGSIASQTAILTEPHNTLYVTRQGGARSQALGVDQPSISSTTATIKSQTPTGLGVDKPVYIGVQEDPKIQARRRGSLHVDKTPVFADNALNDPNNKYQNSYSGNLIQANSNAVNGKPPAAVAAGGGGGTARSDYSLPLRRRSSFNGLNVDQPIVATSNVAGSGSTDSTNRNRPEGIYNSGYNVDRAGHHDQKRSGFGVDKPAIVTHQMATVNKSQQQQQQQLSDNTNSTTTTTTNSHSHSPTFNKLHNPTNSSIYPYSTTTTVSETQVNPTEIGPTITYQQTPSSGLSSSAPAEPLVIPADYKGPIPQVAPGEHVIWVKKTVVQTEYYDGAHDNAGGVMPPAPVQESGNQNRRGSTGSFLDRIRGRRASAVSIDKGKQRV